MNYLLKMVKKQKPWALFSINGLLARAGELKEEHGEDPKLKGLVDEMQAYFDDSSLFELEVAQQYYLKLANEVARVEESYK